MARHRNMIAASMLTMLLACIAASPARAQGLAVPAQVGYQATVEGLADGSYNLVFLLYDAPSEGTLIWGKGIPGVEVFNGRFAVVLGGQPTSGGTAANLIEAFEDPERYMEVRRAGNPLGPRKRMASAPYAVVADRFSADDADENPALRRFFPGVRTVSTDTPVTLGDHSNPTSIAVAEGFELDRGALLKIAFDAELEFAAGYAKNYTTVRFEISESGTLLKAIEQVVGSSVEGTDVPYTDTARTRAEWLGLPTDGELAVDVDVEVKVYSAAVGTVTVRESTLTLEEVFAPVEGLETIPPEADFSSDVVRDTFPLTVHFEDRSEPGSAEIEAWFWDFGDDLGLDALTGEPLSISTEQYPVHVYAVPPGDGGALRYTVALTVVTKDGESTERKVDYITVEDAK